MLGWGRVDTAHVTCNMFAPFYGYRCTGTEGLVLPRNTAPAPVFGDVPTEYFPAQVTRERERSPDGLFAFELAYDPAAGTVHGRYPCALEAALRAPCLLFSGVVDDAALQPLALFSHMSGLLATVCE